MSGIVASLKETIPIVGRQRGGVANHNNHLRFSVLVVSED
jgi:hypothetical protein